MKQILHAFLLMLLVATNLMAGGCHSTKRVILTAENVILANFNGDASRGIFVISDRRKGQMWFETNKKLDLESLKNVPETSMNDVWQLVISPKDDFLAVLSVGEGHPMVDVFDLEIVFSSGNGWDDKKVRPLFSIDPYPGTVWIEGWNSDTSLEISSDVPLILIDKARRRIDQEVPDTKPHVYYWDISKDAIYRK